MGEDEGHITYLLDRPLRYGPATSLGITLSYGLAFIIGCCGNLVVIVAVLSNRGLRTRTNLFIVNLAVADLMVNLLCVPFALWCNLFDEWIFGELLCKMVSFLQGVSVTASVYTLISISLDRCIVVACPFSDRFSLVKCLVSVWALAILVNLPWTLVYRLKETEGANSITLCMEDWPNRQAEAVYFAFACLSVGFLCPLFAIATCNFMIWRTVFNRRSIGEDVMAQQYAEIEKTKIKVTKMVLVVVILFFLSWLPLYAILCLVKFPGNDEVVASSAAVEKLIHIGTPVAQFLAASNSSINPILYAFMNENFRKGFKGLFCRTQRFYPVATTRTSPLCNMSSNATASTHLVDGSGPRSEEWEMDESVVSVLI